MNRQHQSDTSYNFCRWTELHHGYICKLPLGTCTVSIYSHCFGQGISWKKIIINSLTVVFYKFSVQVGHLPHFTYRHIIHYFLHTCVSLSLENTLAWTKAFHIVWFEMIFTSWNGFILIFEERKQRSSCHCTAIFILFHERLFRTENFVAMEAWRNRFSTL